MTVRVLLVILVLFAGGISLANGQTPPPPPPARLVTRTSMPPTFLGEVKDREYVNRFFSFKITMPDEFSILSREELDIYYAAGADMLKSKDESGTDNFEKSVNRSIPLFAAAKLPPGSAFNSAIEITVVQQPEGATSKMVLAETTKMMLGTGTYGLERHFAEVEFGPWVFTGAEFKTSAFGPEIKQRTYVKMQSGFALMISIIYVDILDLEKYDAILNSITVIPH